VFDRAHSYQPTLKGLIGRGNGFFRSPIPRQRRAKSHPHPRRRNDEVVVRDSDDILATLDAEGTLDGLPFMPEMMRYCGRKFRVLRRVERVYLDHHHYVARLENTVLLEGLRCDGSAHQGCQMCCNLLWKEAWLRPADVAENTAAQKADVAVSDPAGFPVMHNGRIFCQATELIRSTKRLPCWNVRQYWRDLAHGELTAGELASFLRHAAFRKMHRFFPKKTRPRPSAFLQATLVAPLALQAGELVEVRSLAEIKATLDAEGKHRGLSFTPEMGRYCGRRFRVAGRVEKMVIEWTGRMRGIRDTVTLEGVTCQGHFARHCPRGCFHLWREAWLRRVSE